MESSTEISILDSISSNEIIDLTADMLELALDQFIENEVVKNIPIVGSIVKIAKSVTAVRDRLFIRKVCTFLLELKDIPTEKRKKFIKELENDIGQDSQVGEAIIAIIDQADRVEKPRIIGKLFKAAIEGKLNNSDVLHASFIINQTYLGDILELQKLFNEYACSEINFNEEYNVGDYDENITGSCQRLSSVGLLEYYFPEGERQKIYEGNQKQEFVVSPIGKILLKYALLPQTSLCSYCYGEGENVFENGTVICKFCNGNGRILPEAIQNK